MQVTIVKKKRYVLSPEDVKALEVVSSLLDGFIKDEELAEEINSETVWTSVGANVEDAQEVVSTILSLNGIEFDLY
jgi:hypothetical protein